MGDVYITRIGKCLPNEPVTNDEMEGILGMVKGEPSQARPLVLLQNGIATRYYVHNKRGEATHNNAQLTVAAIRNLTDEEFTLNDIELLCCGTTTPDQLVPSHAAMVHGLLNNRPMEIVSPHGVCCSGMQAYKYGFMSVKIGDTSNAVCTGSEASSYGFIAKHFEKELEELECSKQYAVLPFDKEFLRWMLSDGAGAFLLENRPRGKNSLRVEWIDIISFANELDVCMSAGYRKQADGRVRNWRSHEVAASPSLPALRQDIKLLTKYVGSYAVKAGQMVEKRCQGIRDLVTCDTIERRARRPATQTGSPDVRLLAGLSARALHTAFVSHFLSGASVSAISGGPPDPAGLYAMTLASQFEAPL